MDNHNRLRIVVGDRELELEGDKEFMAKYDGAVATLLDALRASPPERRQEAGSRRQPSVTSDVDTGEFGETLGLLPKGATAADSVLLAGLHAQRASEDRTFSTKDANALLLEQSVKIGNPSQCMTNNLKAKRVFKVGDKYRVSKPGEDHLAALLGSA